MSKKITITPEQLSALGLFGPEYYIRFRIVSEDKNRVSAWTSIFTTSA